MRKIDFNEITSAFYGKLEIIGIYKGPELVWRGQVYSCYEKGYWVNSYSWNNNIGWVN